MYRTEFFLERDQVRRFIEGQPDHPVTPALRTLLADAGRGVKVTLAEYNQTLRAECKRLRLQIQAWNGLVCLEREAHYKTRRSDFCLQQEDLDILI